MGRTLFTMGLALGLALVCVPGTAVAQGHGHGHHAHCQEAAAAPGVGGGDCLPHVLAKLDMRPPDDVQIPDTEAWICWTYKVLQHPIANRRLSAVDSRWTPWQNSAPIVRLRKSDRRSYVLAAIGWWGLHKGAVAEGASDVGARLILAAGKEVLPQHPPKPAPRGEATLKGATVLSLCTDCQTVWMLTYATCVAYGYCP